ncbi:MAG: MFS transporter [Chloroflexi bacterium]|nr:MFS transporter [Chloroflexota bacterium]MBT4073692.1 MFS transporter [Chloroflexota bacterium]MBT4514267.1 MFS transporter [Chloroflexota bacterium]MBT6681994.1 MFS transporter [Chloroflexota bacterium]
MSLYLYVPFLPLRAQDLGASNTMVGAVIASYAIAQIALRIPIGVASDVLGRRKPFALIAVVSAILGALWLGVSPNPLNMFLGRALTGVAGAGWVALSILYASYFSSRNTASAMSRIIAVNGIALVLATLIGGWIAELITPTATFYSGVAVGTVSLVLMSMAPEPPTADRGSYSRSTFISILLTPQLILVSVISVFAHFVMFATTFSFVPIFAREIGGSESQIGYVTTAMFAGGVAGTICAPYMAQRVGYPATIVLGSVLVGLSVVVIPSIGDVLGLGIAQAVGGFGRGMEASLLMTLAVLAVVPSLRATAMGIHQAVYAIGMISGPVVAGIVADDISIDAVFYMSAVVAVIGGGLVLIGRLPKTTT